MIRRVAWVTALVVLGVLAALAPGESQPAGRPHRIGVLHEGYLPSVPQLEGLKAGLKALGLEEGRDVTFDVRFSRGNPEVLPALAADVVKAGADVLFASDEEAVRAAKAATPTIPIVFVRVSDPVAAGIVASVAHPGGNVTGIASQEADLVPKRLEILKALVPALRRVWAVYHADDRSSVAAARKAREVAPLLKLEVKAQPVRTSEELVGHLKSLRAGDGVLVPPAVALNIPGVILDLERGSRVAAVHFAAFWVQAGGLVSYGSDFHADGAQAARLVARILKGARPRDLPVEGSNRIELAVNLKTAKGLGVTVPRDILAGAHHVFR